MFLAFSSSLSSDVELGEGKVLTSLISCIDGSGRKWRMYSQISGGRSGSLGGNIPRERGFSFFGFPDNPGALWLLFPLTVFGNTPAASRQAHTIACLVTGQLSAVGWTGSRWLRLV